MSCLDVYKGQKEYSDGEYDIWVRGKVLKVYCSGMQVGQPLEYITLKGGLLDNFSEIYNKRLAHASIIH